MGKYIAVGISVVVLVALARVLYSRKVQQSKRYQATVVPLANIMDVGFIVLAPAVVLLAGYAAPLVMLGICLLAIAAGFAIAYNIRHYEPLDNTDDRVTWVGVASRLALTVASIVNIAYYTLLLVTLNLLPLHAYSHGNLAIIGTIILGALIIIGLAGGMDWLNRMGNRTTAFNLAAVFAVVASFIIYNIEQIFGGSWHFPAADTAISSDDFRKIIGLFAMVQGFEAARYIGVRFSGELRITTMRIAQGISTIVFVALLAAVLILFVHVPTDFTGTAIFTVSKEVGDPLPWLILLAALGSQTSAIINATMSRSDMLVEYKVPRWATFIILLGPAIAVFLLADITLAVAWASRVFAAYFSLQAVIAWILARRAGNWWAVAGFTAIALAMASISIFGISI